ncbi:putative oxalocrotonate tautomerase [Pyrenochaeta sp. MPI-SDFR-AT-0127]|nr:putative oxalocrotonate tautomerase [Pyrenochaeta sp. MPI-SDFR-AT-0127]
MPLWIIYHPPTAFDSEELRTSFAKAITDIYTAAKLPAFYVNVLFQPIQPTSFFIGGVARPSPHKEANAPGPNSTKPFIRITIQNIARKIPNEAIRDRFLGRVDAALKPFIDDAGYDWEYSVEETSRDLWKIQGLVPPMPGSEAELEWVSANEALPFEREKGGLPSA